MTTRTNLFLLIVYSELYFITWLITEGRFLMCFKKKIIFDNVGHLIYLQRLTNGHTRIKSYNSSFYMNEERNYTVSNYK